MGGRSDNKIPVKYVIFLSLTLYVNSFIIMLSLIWQITMKGNSNIAVLSRREPPVGVRRWVRRMNSPRSCPVEKISIPGRHVPLTYQAVKVTGM